MAGSRRPSARAWVAETVAKRPRRPRFFAAFVAAPAQNFDRPFCVAELASGPGRLAKAIIEGRRVEAYAAIDFSNAMHALAREHLGPAAARSTSLRADFRDAGWTRTLGRIDAVVTMQAAHELRHPSRSPTLLRQIREILRPGGLLLHCDHYNERSSLQDCPLFVYRDEQPEHLAAAGFSGVESLLDEGGMALYAARRSRAVLPPLHSPRRRERTLASPVRRKPP